MGKNKPEVEDAKIEDCRGEMRGHDDGGRKAEKLSRLACAPGKGRRIPSGLLSDDAS